MKENILAKINIKKIFLYFTDGKKNNRKELVTLRTADNKCCYFMGETIHNLVKPGWFAKAKIIVYTDEGTYTAEEKFVSIDFSLDKILYTIALPKKWDFLQLRVGDRKTTNLPVKIEFSDGLIIDTNIVNLSATGFSVNIKEELTNLQLRFPCNCKINFPENELEVKAKYVRQQLILDDYELAGYKTCSFKFLNLFPEPKLVIRKYLSEI